MVVDGMVGCLLSKGNALTEEQREIQRLKREVAQLKLERDILNEEG